jgi:hypothetical protein
MKASWKHIRSSYRNSSEVCNEFFAKNLKSLKEVEKSDENS